MLIWGGEVSPSFHSTLLTPDSMKFHEIVHQGLKLAKSLLRIWTISRNTLDQKLLEPMYFLWQQPEKIVYYFCGHCQHFVILTKGTQQRELRHLWAKKKSPFFQADKTLYRETSLMIREQVKSTLICPLSWVPWLLSSTCIPGVVLFPVLPEAKLLGFSVYSVTTLHPST